MDDITGKCASLSLNTKEAQTVSLAPDVVNNSRILVARLFTKRRVNVETLVRTLKSMWRPVQNFEVRDLGSNTVLIIFDDDAALMKILTQGPWSFDKYLIRPYKPKDDESADDAMFLHTSLWVQIHNLPLRRMTRENAEVIGNTLGIVEQVDVSTNGECRGRYIRVRVHINIDQPLCRGRFVNMGETKPLWISFQYERLPIFCYWCGTLNHDEKDCKLWTDSGGTLSKDEQQYGAWLRAATGNLQQPQAVHSSAIPYSTPPRTAKPTPTPPMRTTAPTDEGSHQYDYSWSNDAQGQSSHMSEDRQRNSEPDPTKGYVTKAKLSQKQVNSGGNVSSNPAKSSTLEASEVRQMTVTRDKLAATENMENDVLQAMAKAEKGQRLQLDINTGPTPMIFEYGVGWIDDPAGPKGRFWKRIIRSGEIQSLAPTTNKGAQKRDGPTPLQELDPNSIPMKQGKTSVETAWENKHDMVGDMAEAAM
nr:uncharacterized protein CFP56_75139 [Quercus suber]